MVGLAEPGEGPLANKQVWISKMEVARLAKKETNETVFRGSKRTVLEERVSMDVETRDHKNTNMRKEIKICESPCKYYRRLTNQKRNEWENWAK